MGGGDSTVSVLQALYDSYNIALEGNLVDRTEDIGQQTVLLPVYHSNKRSNGNDIIQITLTSDGNFIKADWIPKDEYIIFPVTERSIVRARGIAPHPLSDELSYLSNELNLGKHECYVEELELWNEFMQRGHVNLTFEAIYRYVIKETILADVINSILGNIPYFIDEKNVVNYIDEKQTEKKWQIEKTFITFIVENQNELQKNLSVSTDKDLHNSYISYVRSINMEKPQKHCNISNELTYCAKSHRGMLGNAKLISVSNNNETYYGRFTSGEEIVNIGYEVSQKTHLMLKYLLENSNNSRWLGETSYLVNWFSDDIPNNEGLKLTEAISVDGDDDLDLEYYNEIVSLGGGTSKELSDYLSGGGRKVSTVSKFYIMIIDKISNGRISIKYFREMSKSDLYKRVEEWYHSTRWSVYVPKLKKIVQQSPSIYRLADYVMGMETEDKTTKITCKNKKLRTKTVERLIPCILDGKKIPLDIVRKMYYNLCKKNSYGVTWNSLVEVGCSIMKKYVIDYKKKGEVSELLNEECNDLSYLYGRLLAVYEKLEADVLYEKSNKTNNEGRRSTNAERLWTVYIKTPARTLMILENKIRPYKERLQKSKPGSYIYYEQLISSIINCIVENVDFEAEKNKPLDENFIFAYYAQKQDLYKKPIKNKEVL